MAQRGGEPIAEPMPIGQVIDHLIAEGKKKSESQAG
jgi:hypothetical protein